ncbi:unnamed protein product [Sphagnum compactum]
MSRIHQLLGWGTSAFESGCAAPARPLVSDVVKKDYPSQFKNSWFGHANIVTCSRDGSAIIWTPCPRKYHGKVGRWVKAYHLRVPPPPMPPPAPQGNGPCQRLLPTPRGVNMIVWSLDNRFVLAAIMDHRICVWNAVDGSLVHSLTGHDKQTYVFDVHPFNPRIAMSAGYDGRVIIWDIWEGHPIKVYETGEYNLVDGHFSPDGSSLVVSDEVGQIYIFGTGPEMSQKDVKYDQLQLWMAKFAGSTSLHEKLEQAIANFVGKPAAMVYGMGFATNSTTIPTLVDKDLVKYLRSMSPAHIYATALSPPAVQQVIYALKVILGEDNSD